MCATAAVLKDVLGTYDNEFCVQNMNLANENMKGFGVKKGSAGDIRLAEC